MGLIKAQIAPLLEVEDDLKEELAAYGEGAYEGSLYHATVSFQRKSTLDKLAVIAKLGAAWVAKHTRVGKKYPVIRCTAKLTSKVAA